MSMRSKALACLRTGRVTIVHARKANDTDLPIAVVAYVASSRPERSRYVVDLTGDGDWSCTCWRGNRGESCAHLAAVQLVTGWPSAAALERAS